LLVALAYIYLFIYLFISILFNYRKNKENYKKYFICIEDDVIIDNPKISEFYLTQKI